MYMRPKGSKAELEARRMRAVAMLEQGMKVSEVARRVGVWPGSLYRWRDAYKRAGKDGLRAKRHPGAKPKLAAQDRLELAELLLKGPPAHGYPTDLWTLPRVAELIEKHFGVRYHPGHVWHLLRGMGWSCQKPERRARERNEAAIRCGRQRECRRIKKSPPQAL